jgi:4-diphosphocytidyl-2-C-methyl-D-erythritol kinase
MKRTCNASSMVSFPPCKINLGLNIISKRADGYHDLVTCFYPVPWHDALEIVPARDFRFKTSGIAIPGPAADNLCVRAYDLLKKEHALKPVAMHLHKVVPIGAGLGGGSADGAFALKSLNALFNLGITSEDLKRYAARLGSDCAFFIDNKPAIGTGRGEILSEVPVSLKGKFLVLVTPEVMISTSDAFSEITPRTPGRSIADIVENHDLKQWKSLLTNDFEYPIFRRFPIIEALQQKFYAFGASYASMSGSGSSVYGIFDQEANLEKEFESMTYWSGHLD